MEIQDNYVRQVYLIEDVHDGDTLKAIVELGYNNLGRITFRLKAINTAEVGKKKQSEARIKLAEDAKNYTNEKVKNHKVRVYSEKFEDGGFGRFLGTLYYENEKGEWINLNEELLQVGLAQKYYLGASKDFGDFK